MIRLMLGDCRDSLRSLPSASVQSVITSPPYYGLRDYGLPPLVWGGDPDHVHEWVTEAIQIDRRAVVNLNRNKPDFGGTANGHWDQPRATVTERAFCSCGAWLGSHGLEPTPEIYLQHEVEIFSEVKRVLRDDGTLWLNLGDSYAGSGKGPTGSNGIGDQVLRQGFENGALADRAISGHRNGAGHVTGYKAKDLMLLPFRVAMALQQDGWYVRSTIPWLKRSSMPESVTDRPSSSVEYVFLLSKSARYFWDPDAIRVESQPVPVSAVNKPEWQARKKDGVARESFPTPERVYHPLGRNRRNSDWFFESWQGMLLDECHLPQALLVNPQPFSGAHFATFPPKLVEPMVKASTRPGDTVLDPFAGAGTVGLVADRLQRDAVLLDLKPEYHLMAQERVVEDAPMFVQLDGMFTS